MAPGSGDLPKGEGDGGGVVSGAGDLKPGVVLDRRQGLQHRVPVAMIGKVYCKLTPGTGR